MIDNFIKTNGDVMLELFPKLCIYNEEMHDIILKIDRFYISCSVEWWYSPYAFDK